MKEVNWLMSIKFETNSAIFLPEIIRNLGNNLKGVELGVWHGDNSAYLLQECSNIDILLGIDPYQPYQDWNRYIGQDLMDNAKNSAVEKFKHFPGRGRLFVGTSVQAVNAMEYDDKIDFIFIDGDHSYERVYEDLNLWYSKVKRGGLFSGHDFSLPGVNQAILQFRKENNIKGFFKVIPNDVWYWYKD